MNKTALGKLIASMVIFGTIGVFVRTVEMPRGFLAMSRGFIGALFLVLVMLVARKGCSRRSVIKNLPKLFLSGAFIGFNWILLFESYSYTTIARSTLSYYMAPLFVVLASPLLLGERLTLRRLCAVGIAILGMVFVSGVTDGEFSIADIRGIGLALGAAVLYAAVTLINKRTTDIDSYPKTVMQLFFAAVTVLPYSLIVEKPSLAGIDARSWLLILLLGVLHTGIAYALFFSSVRSLPAHTIAIISYADPVVAVFLSALIGEPFTVSTAVGAVLIISAALLSEFIPSKNKTIQ